MSRSARVLLIAAAVFAYAAAPSNGDLGVLGCVGQPPEAPKSCAPGRGLLEPRAVAVAPGSGLVFAAGGSSFAVAALKRSARGELTFGSCLSDDGTDGRFGQDGACRDGDALASPASLAVSPDARHLYAAADDSRSVTMLSPDPSTAALAPAGCVADRGAGRCADVEALGAPRDLTFSPDGRNLYVAAGDVDGVLVFSVDGASGAISPRGCVTDNGTDGVCTDGQALRGPQAVAVSPDGADVYVAAADSGAISILRRDASTGALTPAGCVLQAAPPGPCARAIGLEDVNDLAFNADGSKLFATAGSGAVTTFARNPSDGTLRQLACLGSAGFGSSRGCRAATELDGASAVAVAPDGTLVVAAADASTVLEIGVDPATGALARRSCLAAFDTPGCARSAVVEGAADVAIASDGRVYVAASQANAVAALAPAPTVVGTSARVRSAAAVLRVRCPTGAARACSGRLVLESRGRAHPRGIGSVAFRVRRGTVHAVRVPLRDTGARRRRGARRVAAFLRDGQTRGRRSLVLLGTEKHR